MELVLEVVSTEKHLMGQNARHVFYPAGGVIGRSAGCDWVIPDQTRHMSGRHAIVSYESGQFFITDISTNGIYLNGVETLEKNRATPLGDGDKLLMGQIHFQVQVNLEPGRELDPPPLQVPRPAMPGRPGAVSAVNPMDQVDQWAAEQAKAKTTAEREGWHRQAHSMPDDLAPEKAPFEVPKVQSPQPIHPPEPPASNAKSLGGELPENWWDEPLHEPPGQDSSLPEPAAHKPPLTPPGAAAKNNDGGGERLPGKADIPPLPQWAEVDSEWDMNMEDLQNLQTAIAPLKSQPTAASDRGSGAALQAFAEGMGISVQEVENAGGEAFLRRAGMLLRLCMRGLVSASQMRARMKNEFRLDMTLVNMHDNNPIKLSANGEQAIKHLLSREVGSFLPMDQAIEECFEDFQEHQLAVMAGMQGAFLELLDTLSPEALEQRFEKGRGGGLSIGSKTARYWDAYRELHKDLLAEDDIFSSLFAEPFARAYDEQISKLKKTRKRKGK
ncbi:type VI secretion system-associated FHA domain protein TagH [Ketobacter sp.]|uniref:type VI secretion system-associated FHA domain protein TagH n=1 Tax=Ketobacter sp. TaxID=2083498 RepID=UPI000F123BFE|nr:type VI secretion system-associated FHA domain protein TagH [Ketobacter sp.]RLU00553.1 MAG: type VI secretion system-associated FHA domain protein TagH [Ketobacter sp.]